MIFSIALILLFGFIFGKIFEIIKLPKFIGMILLGVILGPYSMNLIDSSILQNSGDIRQIALVVILTRAGLSLNINDLKKLGRPALMMCFVPACFEIVAISILAPLFLNLSYVQSLIMGCVIAAVSPAVIVPRMITLINKEYGVKKSIPQLILAGASVDDVFVIVLFSSLVSLEVSGDFSIINLFKVPISIILGVLSGLLVGIVLNKLFEKIKIEDTLKVVVILGISFMMLELENIIPISSLVGIMVIGICFNRKNKNLSIILSHKYNSIWIFAEIFLFVLVGTLLDIDYLKNSGIIFVIMIIISLFARMLGVLLCLVKTDLNIKEKIFCMGAYIPKATVQAGIGGVAFSMGINGGESILTISILSIIITAPIGAIFVDKFYKKLLESVDK